MRLEKSKAAQRQAFATLCGTPSSTVLINIHRGAEYEKREIQHRSAGVYLRGYFDRTGCGLWDGYSMSALIKQLIKEYDEMPSDGYWDGDHPILQMVERIDRLTQERNELAAQVERLRECAAAPIKLMRSTGELSGWHETADRIESVISETQPAALAALKAEWQADKRRMDWLEHQYVSVRKPARYGSFHAFDANVGDEMEWGNKPSNIRQLIDDRLESIRQRAQEAGDE